MIDPTIMMGITAGIAVTVFTVNYLIGWYKDKRKKDGIEYKDENGYWKKLGEEKE